MFEETQRFRQNWLWIFLVTVTAGLLGYMAFVQDFVGLIALAIIFGLTLLLFYFARLETRVEEDGVHIRFFPFHLSDRVIEWSEIDDFEAEKYRPILEFGGWGLRWRPGRRAYNVSGNKGVRITKSSGKQVVIGSQRPEELEEAIRDANE